MSQYIHKAMKNWSSDDGHDLNEKDRISKIIRNNSLHHFPLLDETIFINKQTFYWTKTHPTGYKSKEHLLLDWRVFKPDMLFPLKNLIIEIDGTFHTNTTKGVKQTKLRNQYYEYSGIKLIIFDPAVMKKMSDKKLLAELKARL